jgi:hypothetical protein
MNHHTREKVNAVFDAGFLKVRPGWYGVPDGSLWLFLLFFDEKTGGAIWAEVTPIAGEKQHQCWKAASSLDLMREMMNYGVKPVRSFAQDFTPTERGGDIYYCAVPGCSDPVCCEAKGMVGLNATFPNSGTMPTYAAGARLCALHGTGDFEFEPCMPLSGAAARTVLSGLKGSLVGGSISNGGILQSLQKYFR